MFNRYFKLKAKVNFLLKTNISLYNLILDMFPLLMKSFECSLEIQIIIQHPTQQNFSRKICFLGTNKEGRVREKRSGARMSHITFDNFFLCIITIFDVFTYNFLQLLLFLSCKCIQLKYETLWRECT